MSETPSQTPRPAVGAPPFLSSQVGPGECPTEVDREAFYAQFEPLVSRLIRRYGTTPELRRDLQAEIYYRFCRVVAAYDSSRGVPICAYTARMFSESVASYVQDYWAGESRQIQPQNTQEGAAFHDLEAPAGPAEKLLLEEIRSALPRAIARLPHRQRLALVWRYYDGRSLAAIAADLHIDSTTVRSLLRHAINGLRQPPALDATE